MRDRITKCVLRMIHDGSLASVAWGEGIDWVEKSACGGRKRSQLLAHADLTESLGVTGRLSDRFGSRILQIQDGLHSKLGREDDVWCGKTSVESSILSWTGVHGYLAVALLAEMQDVRGSVWLENCEKELRYSRWVEVPALWSRAVKYVSWKGEEKWKAKGWELVLRGCGRTIIGYSFTAKKNWYAWWTISWRSCWTRTWSPSPSRCDGRVLTRYDAEGLEQGPYLGFALHGSVRCVGISFSSGSERLSGNWENVAKRNGQLATRWLHISIKECTYTTTLWVGEPLGHTGTQGHHRDTLGHHQDTTGTPAGHPTGHRRATAEHGSRGTFVLMSLLQRRDHFSRPPTHLPLARSRARTKRNDFPIEGPHSTSISPPNLRPWRRSDGVSGTPKSWKKTAVRNIVIMNFKHSFNIYLIFDLCAVLRSSFYFLWLLSTDPLIHYISGSAFLHQNIISTSFNLRPSDPYFPVKTPVSSWEVSGQSDLCHRAGARVLRDQEQWVSERIPERAQKDEKTRLLEWVQDHMK